ncbi:MULTISPECIES: glycosyl hydrolase [Alteromonas]|jgi:hypothetical protein|uniref:Glycosyl hydrolase n=1 Tax=Alteromonas stellipolaris TaxID=233316 RepID=A0AAW7Z1V0_9ALTE|nr:MULTISPECIES: glycosyl hydrolase [Alteromonas]ALM91903.1 beta-agarase [Alteromonas stellipolaris LMG 21856]MDO6536395.1 glycosyl hydrolase [Alteromonas stellipolaris]MDO6576541.1 glycosyl hydrolase [Alteromonas stellipolaris]MDO6624717.1 glycosyl hydrolase [Alteromonas stellipolaris]MDP2537533.1 glycosyl hydrolase [Alteromonas stellipolaris]
MYIRQANPSLAIKRIQLVAHKVKFLILSTAIGFLTACADSVTSVDPDSDKHHSAATAPFVVSGHAPQIERMQWSRVDAMSDEFNGNAINLNKWQIEPVGNGWMWIGRPPGLFKPENVSVSNGSMNVEVSPLEKTTELKGREYKYQGAIVRSLEAGQPGWYYEARMKANATEMSSTFWLMTKSDGVKKLELDIQECVGKMSPDATEWAKNWDHIFHSNAIHRVNKHNPEKVQIQGIKYLPEQNHERYFVYAAWWKSAKEIRFYLDGKYVYSIEPSVDWDVPAFYQMAIETYDWNPVPEDGGMVVTGTKEQRTTRYDWIRTWRPSTLPPAS